MSAVRNIHQAIYLKSCLLCDCTLCVLCFNKQLFLKASFSREENAETFLCRMIGKTFGVASHMEYLELPELFSVNGM